MLTLAITCLLYSQNSLLAVQFAGMFTVLVILVSGYHLSQHLRHLHSPVVQRKIMAVLWMTPIYAVTSWLSLLFPLSEPYLAVIREFYESYCVYIPEFFDKRIGKGRSICRGGTVGEGGGYFERAEQVFDPSMVLEML
jgi:uncharacterized protein YggT (Ycf19 family)